MGEILYGPVPGPGYVERKETMSEACYDVNAIVVNLPWYEMDRNASSSAEIKWMEIAGHMKEPKLLVCTAGDRSVPESVSESVTIMRIGQSFSE